jgi:integrase
MGIYKRENDVYYISKTIDGKRFKKSLRTKNIKTAKKRAKILEEKWYKERYSPKQPKSQSLSKSELYKRFFAEKHFNKKATKQAYKKAITMLSHIENCNENSKRFVWRHLKHIYSWGINKGYIKNNPYEDKPTTSLPNVKYYSDERVNKVLDSLRGEKKGDIIKFAFNTGARLGELATLNIDNVNEHNIIFDGKTGRRPFPINDIIQELIDKGRIFNYDSTNAVRLALYRPHKLNATKIRHTFATRLVKNGMDLYRVAKLMGHKSVKTTEKYYAHLKPTDIDDYGDYLGY